MADSTGKKRKRPQFVHLPPTQAAKAKQAWVHKVKLRSQWAKQKRNLAPEFTREEEMGGEEEGEAMGKGEEPSVRREEVPSRERKEKSQELGNKKQHESKEMKERREKVRDLTRTAYARESLHTFKAGRGRHGQGKGRGQPNMKLRMNALLEKIKMDAGVD